jgi:hypothetical protein
VFSWDPCATASGIAEVDRSSRCPRTMLPVLGLGSSGPSPIRTWTPSRRSGRCQMGPPGRSVSSENEEPARWLSDAVPAQNRM